jgi:hypothetical protein
VAIYIARREFIGLIGGAVVPLPLAARAQQQPKMLRVGFVGMQPRESPLYGFADHVAPCLAFEAGQ